MKHKSYLVASLLLTGALSVSPMAWAKGAAQLRAGKAAFVRLYQPAEVGNLLLTPGRYSVRDHVAGNVHYFTFQRWTSADPEWDLPSEQVGRSMRVACRMEPLGTKAANTEVIMDSAGKVDRITRIEIAGENVEHLF